MLSEPNDVLFRLKRGLTGYVSYLAACEMNQAFSEYILYEPTLRILTERGYKVECECPCPVNPNRQRKKSPSCGDKKRVDFYAKGNGLDLAIEVKWAKKHSLNVQNDVDKLLSFQTHSQKVRSFLCVFGRWSFLENLELNDKRLFEKGKCVYANFRKTKYACRVYELKSVLTDKMANTT